MSFFPQACHMESSEVMSPAKHDGEETEERGVRKKSLRQDRGRVDGALLCLELHKENQFKRLPSLPAAKELARCMHEPKFHIIRCAVERLGLEKVLQLFKETSQIQEAGGILAAGGKEKKTPGGVFFALMKKSASKKDRSIIFKNEREKHKLRKIRHRQVVRRAKVDAEQGREGGAEWDGNEGGGVTESTKVTPGQRRSVFSRLGVVNVEGEVGSGVDDASPSGNGTALDGDEGGVSGVAMETREAESALSGRGCLGSPKRGEEGGEGGGEGDLMEVEEGEMVDAVALTEAEVSLGESVDVNRTVDLASQDLQAWNEVGYKPKGLEEGARETADYDCTTGTGGDTIETECQAALQEFDALGDIHTSFTLPD